MRFACSPLLIRHLATAPAQREFKRHHSGIVTGIRARYGAPLAPEPMRANRLPLASFDALADARERLDMAIAQAMVRVARVKGSEHAEAEAHRLSQVLAVAIEAVRTTGR